MSDWIVSFYPEKVLDWFLEQEIPISTWRDKPAWERCQGLPTGQRYIGPMAQDVLVKHPNLVITDPATGYLAIDVQACCAAAGVPYEDGVAYAVKLQ